jgi:hypothetical protein
LKHKNNDQEDLRCRGGTHVGVGVGVDVGDAAVVTHVVVEAADVREEVLVREEVVGIRGEEVASSRAERSPKMLSPLSRTGSQEAGFQRSTVPACGARCKTDREDGEAAQSSGSQRKWLLYYVFCREE